MATVKIGTLLIRVKHLTTHSPPVPLTCLPKKTLAKPISSRIKTQARE